MTRLLVAVVLLASGCNSVKEVADPMATLQSREAYSDTQLVAMGQLDIDPTNEEYLTLLRDVIWKPGYQWKVRLAAMNRLEEYDREGLVRTLRQHVPRMPWSMLQDFCALIGERKWIEVAPGLVSSWARPSGLVKEETERPEYLALAQLYGEDEVINVVYECLLDTDSRGLRERSWELLNRLNRQEQLITLLIEGDIPEDDLMLQDLRAGAVELGIVPANREEVLWLRKLRQPEYAKFWSRLRQTLPTLDEETRLELELRDLPIVVAASLHDPEMLERSWKELFDEVNRYVSGQKHYSKSAMDSLDRSPQTLWHFRDKLKWGDLAAMLMLIRSLEASPVVDHLFNYAERDREDKTSEFGGVMNLDDQGRFELLEFPPHIRRNDRMFIASQEMFDAAYTAQFHFHYHAQRHRNVNYAGPGQGDLNYADNTRANCVVFTYVDQGRLNIDYYRHGRVVVDLGVVELAGRR